MTITRTITPYPPKLEGFQTCVWMGSFSSPLWRFLHPSRVVPVCQAESGSHRPVSQKIQSLHRVQRYWAQILSYLWHWLHYHSLVSIIEPSALFTPGCNGDAHMDVPFASVQESCSHLNKFSWRSLHPS